MSEVSKQEAKPVGSLVLSPLFGAFQEDVKFLWSACWLMCVSAAVLCAAAVWRRFGRFTKC